VSEGEPLSLDNRLNSLLTMTLYKFIIYLLTYNECLTFVGKKEQSSGFLLTVMLITTIQYVSRRKTKLTMK